MNKNTNESIITNQKAINKQLSTKMIAKMAVLIAIAIVLVLLIHFPIFPAVSFLEYDPADIPILIGAMAFGPMWGAILTIVTSVIQGLTVSAASGPYGIIMHIIATLALTLTSSLIYFRHKTRVRAITGLSLGILAMVIVMFFANMIITPLFMGASLDQVMALMPFIILFNLIKAAINAVVTFFIYKRISGFLHK